MFWIIFVSPTLGTQKVNALDRHSDTPLSWAARSGHLDAVREDPATKHAKIFGEFHFFTTKKRVSIGRCSWPDLNKIQGRKYREMHFFQFSCFRRGCNKESCLHKMICLFPRSRSSSSIGQIPCWSLGYRPWSTGGFGGWFKSSNAWSIPFLVNIQKISTLSWSFTVKRSDTVVQVVSCNILKHQLLWC